MSTLKEQILKEAPRHASIPFWSWNDRLDEKELRRQIRHMKSVGMRGFFMHARGGLETEYMSREWFDAVRACVDEAEKLGMEAWAYDENGWPSGFAGGELLKDPRDLASGLHYETTAVFPDADEDILGVYVRTENDGVKRVEKACGAQSYIVIRRVRDISYVDTMNGDITRRFLALTHERYLGELPKGSAGHVMPGFFTDEPQYWRYGTPWSDTFPEAFRKRFGYEVFDGLPALFFDYPGAQELRYDYHLLCHERFYSEFMSVVYDWCEQHGMQLTGHGIEEWGLGGQMMCCGGVMPFYLYQHIPGIDYLGRGIKNISGAKQLGSVCAQTGKRTALSEMFACCGWDVTPRELKRIVELQFAGGVNLICEHLYAYSERGQRKRDFPNHYSEHNPWSGELPAFERYFSHLGAALSIGEELADTLVLHPIRTAYLHYKHTVHSVGIGIAGNDESGIGEAEQAFEALVRKFSDCQIPYHFGDETVMRKLDAHVEGDTLCVGRCRYRNVVLPSCETLDAFTVALLREYLDGGGRLLIIGAHPMRIDGRCADLSFLQSNLTFEALRERCAIRVRYRNGDAPLQLQMRQTAQGRMVYLVNPSDAELSDVEITLKDCVGLCALDVDTLDVHPLRGRVNPDGSATVWYDFADSESCLLIERQAAMSEPKLHESVPEIPLPTDFRFCERPENMMLLERAALSVDGGRTYSEERPITRIRDNLLRERFAGMLSLRFTFRTEFLPERLLLVSEPMRELTVSVNGQPCAPYPDEWRIDRRFEVRDIANLAIVGENRVELTFPYRQSEDVYRVLYGGGNEALRNCLCFDTEVESVYLFGSFCVRPEEAFREHEGILENGGAFTLVPQTDEIELSDINRHGYPFFAGQMLAERKLIWHAGDATRLCLHGRFAVCGVIINGTDLGNRIFTDCFELAPYLREGENELILRLIFSNRNLLGSHHAPDPEPFFVTPRTFSFEKQWVDGVCPNYRRDASFVRFGIGFFRKG